MRLDETSSRALQVDRLGIVVGNWVMVWASMVAEPGTSLMYDEDNDRQGWSNRMRVVIEISGLGGWIVIS